MTCGRGIPKTIFVPLALQLKHRQSFRKTYLLPALSKGLIAMTQPDHPQSPTQKYYLTEKGEQKQKNL